MPLLNFDSIRKWREIRNLEAIDQEKEVVPPLRLRHILLTLFLIPLLFLTPWRNGSIEWESQWVLWLYAIPLAILLPILSIGRQRSMRIPAASMILIFAAVFAWMQTIPWAGLKGSDWVPASIRMQRWCLGETVSVGPGLFSDSMHDALQREASKSIDGAPKVGGSKQGSDKRLAISMDPDRTRLALCNLCVAAILIWASAIAFEHRRTQLILLFSLLLLGIFVAAMSFVQHVAWKIPDWALVRDANSVGPFANKNIGGAYLNLGLAAAISLTWAAICKTKRMSKRQDARYEIPTAFGVGFGLGKVVHFLRDLNAHHNAYFTLIAVLASAIVGSLSRGAAISSVVAIVALLVIKNRKRGHFGGLVVVGVAISVAIGLLAIFDLDQMAGKRYGELFEGDDIQQGGRMFVWWSSIRAFLYYGLTGAGFGCFRWGFLPFADGDKGAWYCYAESIWGHVIVELGLVGGLLLVVMIRELFSLVGDISTHYKVAFRNPAAFGSLFAILCFLFHSCLDFGLIVPGNFVPFCMLIGAAYAAQYSQLRHSSREQSKHGTTKRIKASRSSELPVADKEGTMLAQENIDVRNQKRRSRRFLSPVSSLPMGLVIACFCVSLLLNGLLRVHKAIPAEKSDKWLDRVSSTKEFVETDGLESIYQGFYEGRTWSPTADSLRIKNQFEIGVWRQKYLKFVRKTEPKAAWYVSDPVLVRIAFSRLQRTEVDFQDLIGGKDRIEAWDEIRSQAQTATYFAPLDWRNGCDSLVFNWHNSSEEDWLFANRMRVLSKQQPHRLVEIGWLALESGDSKLSQECFRSAMNVRAGLSEYVVRILSTQAKDGEIDTSIFPLVLDFGSLAANFPMATHPMTNQGLWERERESASRLSRMDRNRWLRLSRAEEMLNHPDQSIEMLEQLVTVDERIESWLQLYNSLLKSEDHSERAEEVRNEVIRRFPDDPKAAKLRADLQ